MKTPPLVGTVFQRSNLEESALDCINEKLASNALFRIRRDLSVRAEVRFYRIQRHKTGIQIQSREFTIPGSEFGSPFVRITKPMKAQPERTRQASIEQSCSKKKDRFGNCKIRE